MLILQHHFAMLTWKQVIEIGNTEISGKIRINFPKFSAKNV